MSNKLFVGSLSWGTDEYKLRQLFSQYGTIEDVKIILDRETQRSRGFGFVTFQNSDEAKSAMHALNGHELDGRTISVSEPNERR